jgi:hypothetical protein
MMTAERQLGNRYGVTAEATSRDTCGLGHVPCACAALLSPINENLRPDRSDFQLHWRFEEMKTEKERKFLVKGDPWRSHAGKGVGRIMNQRTARSQFIGGIVWGISLTLHENTGIDWRYGRITNPNLADYLVPTNADIQEIDVSALDIPDYKLDSVGARGVGEIGITGTGAAISNAIFHATGKRIRDLPITSSAGVREALRTVNLAEFT